MGLPSANEKKSVPAGNSPVQQSMLPLPLQQYRPSLHCLMASLPAALYLQKVGQSWLCQLLSEQVRRSR